MHKYYFEKLNPKIRAVCLQFDKFNINYNIIEDKYNKQTYQLSSNINDLQLTALQTEAAIYGVTVIKMNDKLSIATHKLTEAVGQPFCLERIPSSAHETVQNRAIEYLGEKNRAKFSELFYGVSVPTKVVDVYTLWTSHINHPRWIELGDAKTSYINNRGPFPPVVVDTLNDDQKYPSGVLIDGFRRLYAAHSHNDPLLECVDMQDIITEVSDKLLSEDQYKSPTRRMIQKQTAYRSSFGPSRSFGGISGYSRNKRKKHMKEFHQNTIGTITKDLVAHDNFTVIPRNSVVKIVDCDESLPDVEFNGQIVNVDHEKLMNVFKPNTFSERLESLMVQSYDHPKIQQSKFEQQLNDTFGIISIKVPDILISLNQTLKGSNGNR